MNHSAKHHDKLLIEESGVALNALEARGYRTISKRGESNGLEKTFHLGRHRIAPERNDGFSVRLNVSGVETVFRWGLVAKCHAPQKAVAS